jgi:beta-galactosidase
MNRRDFVKTAGTLLAGAVLAPSASDAEMSARSSATARLTLPMNRNWRFSRAATEAARSRDFDDSRFESVVVPHTNIRLPWHSFDEKDYQLLSVYRRRFKLPAEARGRHQFVDFEGVMTATTVWLNGTRIGEYKGGYTPFSFDLTPHTDFDGENVLVVEVDSRERPDIPPFGGNIDYLTFGGIYREVALRIVHSTFIENIFARPRDVLSAHPALDVDCFLQHLQPLREPLSVEVELRDGDRTLARATQRVPPAAASNEGIAHTLHLDNLSGIELWDLSGRKLYRVHVRLLRGTQILDNDSRRIGIRQAQFTDHGFELNGKLMKLRGLDRHQTFPYVGQAMPARVQRRDALILREQLKCNIVRTSHYPQSSHFLDACDELGLLVLEEIPGWQHIGDESWKQLAIDNTRRMIRRDWNHPAIILWGVRINESSDDHDFYMRTNELAHQLDPTRQTGGIRAFQESEFLEDVFTMNDFGFPLKPPNHPRYLNTEFVGHTYNTKSIDNADRLIEHTVRHARVHDQLASDQQYAGGIGWCAFDYNTHANFGSGDRVCYHGVNDMFREPKPAAGFYKSQCDPDEEPVIELAFHWAPSDAAGGLSNGMICSNCDHLKLYINDKLIKELDPDRGQFPHLRYAPYVFEFGEAFDDGWGELRVEGYVQGKLAITRRYSAAGVDQKFMLAADDTHLVADGADTTRVVLRVTDEYGNVRPFANDAIHLELDGPAEVIGDNPSVLMGGVCAVWVRAGQQAGAAHLKATHPRLGSRVLEFELAASESERV